MNVLAMPAKRQNAVTAVEAIKLGARHYLAKPANTDDIEAAFTRAAGNVETELTKLGLQFHRTDLQVFLGQGPGWLAR